MFVSLPALILAAMAALFPPSPATAGETLEELVAVVEKSRESTELEVLDKIAAFGDRPAALALIKLYSSQGSLAIRLRILELLPGFDDKGDIAKLVLQRMMDIATGSSNVELRDAALIGLAGSPANGRRYLQMIVLSPAADQVRVRALELHLKEASEADQPWYRDVYERERGLAAAAKKKGRKKSKKKKGKKGENAPVVHPVTALREMSFKVLRANMDKKELVNAIEEGRSAIRLMALEQYAELDLKAAAKLAEPLYRHPEELLDMRILAAEIMARVSGKKIAKKFINDAHKFVTPEKLRVVLARLVEKINDPATNKKLKNSLRKGRAHERRFNLRALRSADMKKLDEEVLEIMISDEDASVVRTAAGFLARRGRTEAGPAIEELISKSKNANWSADVLEMLGELYGASGQWKTSLEQYVKDDAPQIRNGAIRQLAAYDGASTTELLEQLLAHENWSTRLASLKALTSRRETRALGPMVEQMQLEEGRMRVEFAAALYSLTGKPFEKTSKSWLNWWKREGAEFEVISEKELALLDQKRELRRRRSGTTAAFFGIRIISHRVIFIVDVSGSMEEAMRQDNPEQIRETRMDVARRELLAAVMALDSSTLYNILAFSFGVTPWSKDGLGSVDVRGEDGAADFIAGLRAGGGTNLYDALATAFADESVDTIYVLSDGQPSMGRITDIYEIREAVARWNRNRGITINTVGIGTELRILEWLAEDSGGDSTLLF